MMLTSGFCQENCRCGGNVKGVDLTVHGDGNDGIAGFLHDLRDTVALTAKNDCATAFEVGIVNALTACFSGVGPNTFFFQRFNGGSDVCNLCNRKMLDSTCRSL